jgi:hypothetical protein
MKENQLKTLSNLSILCLSLEEYFFGNIQLKRGNFVQLCKVQNMNEGLYIEKNFRRKNGGERGIRTLEAREGLPVFKTGVFNRSTSSPSSVLLEMEPEFNRFLILTHLDFFSNGRLSAHIAS